MGLLAPSTANTNIKLQCGCGPKAIYLTHLKYINTKAQNQMPNGLTSELSTGVVRQKISAALPAPEDLIKNPDLDMDNGDIEREYRKRKKSPPGRSGPRSPMAAAMVGHGCHRDMTPRAHGNIECPPDLDPGP